MTSNWKREAEKYLDDDPISASKVAFELNRLWDEDTIWVTPRWFKDAGTPTMTSQVLERITLTKPGTFFSNPSGLLGPVASMAYGIALARPREKVVAMVGDGDFIMGNPNSALWTCSHYHIPVLYVVLNNACWGTNWSDLLGSTLKVAASRKNYEFVDIDEPRIDFAKLAETCKVKSETLTHPEDAGEKLKWAFNVISKGEPALIDIQLQKYTKGKSSYIYSFQRPAKKTEMEIPLISQSA
jgi:thiamine pyrophosphate-dependent acetolactate synthase large subunit-like protein